MGDVMPDYKVEMQRLVMQIAAQEHAVQQRRLEIMEMADRKKRAIEAIDAAKKAIAKIKKDLESLEGAHGKLTEGELE